MIAIVKHANTCYLKITAGRLGGAEQRNLRTIDFLRQRRASRPASQVGHVTGAENDVDRIVALPRTPPPTDVTIIADLVSKYTRTLRKPSGEMTLFDVQAVALHYAALANGLFGNIGVARGKTLLSLLLPRTLGATRTVLLIPPAVKAQLLQKAYPALREHWQLPEILTFTQAAENDWSAPEGAVVVVTHSELSDRRYRDVLQKLNPTDVVIDEAHAFCGDSARSKRLYAFARTAPDTRFCVMAGTLIDSDDMTGPAGLARLVFKAGSPFPYFKATTQKWNDALHAGASRDGLERLCAPGEPPRAAFRRRILETKGVVTAQGKLGIAASLLIRKVSPRAPGTVTAALRALRDSWTTPRGAELTDILEVYRHALELAQGFCYRWAWPGGIRDEEWMSARSAWAKAVRRKLQSPRAYEAGLDSEALLEEAAAAGKWVTDAYAPWAAVKNRPLPPTVADWVDPFLVEYAVKWGRANTGIIWYESTVIGRAIAEAGGFPLYDDADSTVGLLDERGDRTIVGARRVLGTGLELEMFNRGLVLCPPASAKAWEQLLGRYMRSKQKAPTVEIDVCQHTPELRRNLEEALKEARLLKEIAPGAENQLLLMADLSE